MSAPTIGPPGPPGYSQLDPLTRSLHRKATLVHEAGHSVAYVAQGIVFDNVVILGDKSGRVHADDARWDAQEPGNERKYAIGVAAGLQAELAYLRAIDHPELYSLAEYGAEWDYTLLRDYAGKAGGLYSVNQAKAEAYQLVQRNWPAIMRTAAALQRARTLQYRQAAAAAAGATR